MSKITIQCKDDNGNILYETSDLIAAHIVGYKDENTVFFVHTNCAEDADERNINLIDFICTTRVHGRNLFKHPDIRKLFKRKDVKHMIKVKYRSVSRSMPILPSPFTEYGGPKI